MLAGGSGVRSGAAGNKVLARVGDRPLLTRPVEVLAGASDAIVAVARRADVETVSDLLARLDLERPHAVVAGGASRHRSEVAGLAAASELGACDAADLIAVHDGARPLVTAELVERLYAEAERVGGAWPALAAHSVYRPAHGGLQPAGELLRAQTPQVFRAAALHAAYERAAAAGFEGTDTLETVLRHGDLECGCVEGDPVNIKVTYPDDFTLAERLLAAREGQRREDRP